MTQKTASLFVCCMLLLHTIFAQKVLPSNNNITGLLLPGGNNHGLFKTNLVFFFNKGFSLGLGYGLWHENPSLQYSLNTGLQFRFGKGFLGNLSNGETPDDPRSKLQVNFVFTPMLTVNFSKHSYVYQELEPFYLGTPNAVFCRYRTSFTAGTSFVVSPGGTSRNTTTTRNSTQQVAVLSLNLQDFNFTMYDDYLDFVTEKGRLGDNWDRFYTGGGFLRYRFSNNVNLHLYSEVYTGINRANTFLNPDIISYTQRGKKWGLQNFANQDPGQEFFNSSWFIAKLSYDVSPGSSQAYSSIPSFSVMAGTAAPWTMFSQSFIHDRIPYDSTNHFSFHHFLNRNNVQGNYIKGSIFYGGSVESNFSMQ